MPLRAYKHIEYAINKATQNYYLGYEIWDMEKNPDTKREPDFITPEIHMDFGDNPKNEYIKQEKKCCGALRLHSIFNPEFLIIIGSICYIYNSFSYIFLLKFPQAEGRLTGIASFPRLCPADLSGYPSHNPEDPERGKAQYPNERQKCIL